MVGIISAAAWASPLRSSNSASKSIRLDVTATSAEQGDETMLVNCGGELESGGEQREPETAAALQGAPEHGKLLLQQRQSLCYIFSFVAAGLMVGEPSASRPPTSCRQRISD